MFGKRWLLFRRVNVTAGKAPGGIRHQPEGVRVNADLKIPKSAD
jgi:hypothetical protein